MDKKDLDALILRVVQGNQPVLRLKPRTAGDGRTVRLDRHVGEYFYGVFVDEKGHEPPMVIHDRLMIGGSFRVYENCME